MKGQNPPCPCGSGLKYGACCRPFHRGEEPPDPVRLMRSRYAAYALGESTYLVRTLHPEHPDLARPEAELVAELRRSRQRLKFARLRVLDHDLAPDGRQGRVLFHAELFEAGEDRSFLERSHFARTAEGWRYLSGETRALGASAPGLEALTLSTAVFP
jgi:SEC-C motif-containing protein